MPRKYKPNPRGKRYRPLDKDALQQAIDAVKKGLSLREAGRRFDIHFTIIGRYLRKKNIKPQGGQTVLSKQDEDIIVDRILTCAKWGYPIDHFDLRVIVKGYLDRLGRTVPKFKDNMPGPDFAVGFVKRHKDVLAPRTCQNIKRSRAATSPEDISSYFDHLEKSLENVPPSNIVNFDETNLSDDPGRKTIITKRGCKYPERVMNSTKSSTSIMFAASGDGVLLPCYVVYKALNLYSSWTEGGPKGTRYNRTTSGWFDGTTFDDWVATIAVPYLKKLHGKKILIGDNLSSHLSVDSIKLCRDNNIDFVFLPANSTHLTQPLDVAFFRPLKSAWRKILTSWKMGPGRNLATIPKNCFPRLLTKLVAEIDVNKSSNIKAGFLKTGIVPVCREKVLVLLPQETDGINENRAGVVDASFVSLLKNMRYGDAPKKRRQGKKLQVVAGKSVTFDSSEDSSENESNLSEDSACEDDVPADNMSVSDISENNLCSNDLSNSSDGDSHNTMPITNIKHPISTSPNKPSTTLVHKIEEKDIHVNDWLLVEFPTEQNKPGTSKPRKFIGKVLELKPLCGSFLRGKPTRDFNGYVYRYPDVPDICFFSFNQVVGALDSPTTYGRGLFKFAINV